MKIILKECTIADVQMSDNGGRIVTLLMNEEDLFEMFDKINPKNIIKYLDMRNIVHREAPIINLYAKDKGIGMRNKRKLDKCYKLLKQMNNDN